MNVHVTDVARICGKSKGRGVNTIETYVFWDGHETLPEK